MHFPKNLIFFISIIFLLSSCNQTPEKSSNDSETTTETAKEPVMEPPAPAPAIETEAIAKEEAANDATLLEQQQTSKGIPSDTTMPALTATDGSTTEIMMSKVQNTETSMFSHEIAQRKFIFTADLNFRVKNVYDSTLEIENLAYELGGFVLKNEINTQIENQTETPQKDNKLLRTTSYINTGEMIVRIPNKNTQEFLRKLKKEIDFLKTRSFNAKDITIDELKQQLAQKRTEETQRRLGKATNQVRGENKIDAINDQDRMKANRDEAKIAQAILQDQASYSTINLSLYQPEKIIQEKVDNIQAIIADNAPSFSSQASDALTSAWMLFLNFILWIIEGLFIWIMVIAVLAIATKKHFQQKKQKNTKQKNDLIDHHSDQKDSD